jgi:hypothetical protein
VDRYRISEADGRRRDVRDPLGPLLRELLG